MRQLRRFPRRNRRGEQGAVLVEAAIVTPLITLLVFGLIEFGFVWKDKLTLASASRQGARVGSAAGNDPMADFAILKAIEGSVASVEGLESIVVFKANGPSGTVPPECTHGAGISGKCNVYSASDLSMSEGAFAATSKKESWPAGSRQTRLKEGPDYLGVWVNSSYSSLVGIVNDRMLSDYVVMRLEPKDYS